ncbi:HNH endonuclease signature motif containing protein [Streptomyces sp. PvR034]|uniref:HNH endonuclease n=1 Tax=Streptomyces sp. PvR034 TaxID=3156401 RepID=UPI00339B0DFF
MPVGEYLNWAEGNAIVPYENPRRKNPRAVQCSVHRWFREGSLRCTYCGAWVFCSCGTEEFNSGVISGLRVADLFKRQATLDHVIPRIHGGVNEADNVAVACRSCNSSKQDLGFPGEWIPNRDLHTYIACVEPLPQLEGLSKAARGVVRLVAQLDPQDHPPSVAEVCADQRWRPREVHLALAEIHQRGAFYVFASPCAPAARYFQPVTDPDSAFAGGIWVDGWG